MVQLLNTNTTFDGKKTPASDSFDASIRAHRNKARQIILEIFASVNTHPNATMALLENIGEIAKFFWSQRDDEFFITSLSHVLKCTGLENEARVLIEHFRCCHGVWSIRHGIVRRAVCREVLDRYKRRCGSHSLAMSPEHRF